MSRFVAAALALAATAAAHGIVTSASADGVTERGYNPEYQWTDPNAKVVGWSTPNNIELAFVALSNPTSPDIICHGGATNAQKSLNVKAGSTVSLQWTPWPESHHGPVLDYLASCNGNCATVDKTSLKFFKIAEAGLTDGSYNPGKWASDQLIANGNKWSVKVPSDIPDGEYVLRHEIIALHAAHEGRAESYPQCINIKVSGGSGGVPDGVSATQLYKSSDPGIAIDIYKALGSYKIPGPALYSGKVGSSNNQNPASSSSSSASAAASPTSSAAAASSSAAAGTTAPPASTPTGTTGGTIDYPDNGSDDTADDSTDDTDSTPSTGSGKPTYDATPTIDSATPTQTATSGRGRKGKGRGRNCGSKSRYHARALF